jgi:hypothetical protein
MSLAYESDSTLTAEDDLVRGMAPGHTVSKVYVQNGFIIDGDTSDATASPSGFRVYKGGELSVPVNGQTELWNDLIVMYRDGQVWIWWNNLLISPDTVASQQLPSPVAVNTAYFPLNPQVDSGKVAFRMFPGAILRYVEIRDQVELFNEFILGQLELTS